MYYIYKEGLIVNKKAKIPLLLVIIFYALYLKYNYKFN